MTTEPFIRLYLYFARDVPKAVILRQGPRRQFRMILWDRDDDSFEDGQWLMAQVYPDRCGISPDARHFLYFALDGRWRTATQGTYTAISRPPFWTALSLFPEGSTWGGGGHFLDSVHYYASGGDDIIGRDFGLNRVTYGEPGKGCTTGIRLLNGQRAPLDRAVTRRLLQEPVPSDPRGFWERCTAWRGDDADRYDTQGGCLYRRAGGEMELIRDFRDMAFEPMRAPYDWRDPPEPGNDTPPWHPLDDNPRRPDR